MSEPVVAYYRGEDPVAIHQPTKIEFAYPD